MRARRLARRLFDPVTAGAGRLARRLHPAAAVIVLAFAFYPVALLAGWGFTVLAGLVSGVLR